MAFQPFKETQQREIFFPAQYESLTQVRDFVAQAARDSWLSEEAVYAVQLAVDEACSNIIEHAFGGECQEKIQCTCLIREGELAILLKDCGRPFNPVEVPKPDLGARLEDRQAGGLGLHFMRSLMDEINFSFIPGSSSENGCNVLKMVKRKEKAA